MLVLQALSAYSGPFQMLPRKRPWLKIQAKWQIFVLLLTGMAIARGFGPRQISVEQSQKLPWLPCSYFCSHCS